MALKDDAKASAGSETGKGRRADLETSRDREGGGKGRVAREGREGEVVVGRGTERAPGRPS